MPWSSWSAQNKFNFVFFIPGLFVSFLFCFVLAFFFFVLLVFVWVFIREWGVESEIERKTKSGQVRRWR